MERLLHDLRYAVRSLGRSPAFTVLTVVTLALGVGVNSLVFRLVDAVLFRPLPVREPGELVRAGMCGAERDGLGGVSYPLFRDLSREADSLAGLAAFMVGSPVNLSIEGAPAERVVASNVSGSFFELLGVHPLAGRLLNAQDDVDPGGHPVLVLGAAYWQRRFGSDPSVVGRTVRLNTHPFTVVGIAPHGFQGLTLESVPDLWVPLAMAAQVTPSIRQFAPFERRGFGWLSLVARLGRGADVGRASAQLDAIRARIDQELKLDNAGDLHTRLCCVPLAEAVLDPGRAASARHTSWMLAGVAGLVLVVAWAVSAGLLLVRGERRRHELAVRLALGASRARLVRQLLVESLLISAAAAGSGLLLAAWSADALLPLLPPGFPLPAAAATPGFSVRAVVFTAALAMVGLLAFGLLPAFRASRPEPLVAMKRGSAARGGRWHFLSLRHSFVVVQMALSVVLLVGAGLLLRTLAATTRVDLGFRTSNVLVASLDVSKSGYDRARGLAFDAQLLERVRAIPGVRSAALATHVPVQSDAMLSSVELTNVPPSPPGEPRVSFASISADYFRTLGIALLVGRELADADAGGPAIVVVNRAFVERFWPGLDPLQQRVENFGEHGAAVIGVVADAKLFSIRETPTPMLYVPEWDFYVASTNLVVRATGDPAALAVPLAAAVAALDGNVPVYRVRTLADHVGAALSRERVSATFLSAFSLLALALASIGLYGAVSYTTQIRAREFGIRLAVGARPAGLMRLVLAQGAGLTLGGLVVGLCVAVAASRVLTSLLYGVIATDGLTYVATSAVLMGVALAACAVPARRAMRLDPTALLRDE